MFQKFINISQNSLKRDNLRVMAQKVITRFTAANDSEEAVQWASENAQSLDDYIQSLNPAQWQETQKICDALTGKAKSKLDALGMDLGGGGHYYLLHFLVRHFKPEIIVETGVAAGWSSQAILTAINENKSGHLYSSDFPYFRYKNPEKYVGYVVDEDLKKNWDLFIDGDQNNLPKITHALNAKVDLFHYDSDKSSQGRDFAFHQIAPHLSTNALVIFDDIQDNLHFKNFVSAQNWDYKIFEFEGKYIGLTGPNF
jgi:predicted O-methyltransferase YrrM